MQTVAAFAFSQHNCGNIKLRGLPSPLRIKIVVGRPFSQHNQMWSFEFNAQGQAVVSVRIGERRWELRLKGGARYARQTAGLKKLAQRGELAIYKSHDGTILCKLVGWLERPTTARGMAGTLHVRTAADRLLVAVDEKDEPIWSQNCDHLRRWIAEHKGRLKR